MNIEMFAQADIFLWLAQLFGTPSDDHRCGLQLSPAEQENLLIASGFGERKDLRSDFAKTVSALDVANIEDWTCEHAALFEGAVACPINESAWVRRDKGAILADICAFHKAFGFRHAQTSAEKPDHLIAELEVLALLFVMQGQAEAAGNTEAGTVTRGAIESFWNDHPGEWVGAFADQLEAVTGFPLYRQAAVILRSMGEAIALTRGLPRWGTLAGAPPEEMGTPYECGLMGEQPSRPSSG